MDPLSSYNPSYAAQPDSMRLNTSGLDRQTLQAAAHPQAATTGANAALPGQYEQRTPICHAGTNMYNLLRSQPSTSTNNRPPTTVTPRPPLNITQTPAQPTPRPTKNLLFTRNQMYTAQEMFKTANKVTRSEKALILSFMCGFREHPCPEQGDIIQIKLSEHTEALPNADGTGWTPMLVDTVFEMNYSLGMWNRIKKYKPIPNTSEASAGIQSTS